MSELKELLAIEKKYGLYTDKILDECYWEYSRFYILQYCLLSEKYHLKESHVKVKLNKVEMVKKNLIYLWNSFKTRKNIKKGNILFISQGRRFWNGEKFECIYTDRFSKEYEKSVTFEQPYQKQHRYPQVTSSIVYVDECIFLCDLYLYYVKFFKRTLYEKVFDEVRDRIKKPLTEMCTVYNVTLDVGKISKVIACNIFKAKMCKKYYERVLNKVQPSVIVEVEHYSNHCMVLNEIAKRKNIRTIELQHGTMHEEHVAYQYGTEECLPQLPDKILTFSEYWNEIANMPAESSELVAVGYPYFEEQIKKYKHIGKSTKKNILFVSQGTIGDALGKLAEELSRKLDAKEYHIIYKLHPNEYLNWRQRYPWLLHENIEVVDNLERNIYEYFAISDVQVGVYSTALYEGLGFGLKTIIYNIGHADTMKSLVDMGYASLVDNVDELIVNINLNNEEMKKVVFWKENAFENIKNIIDTELSREDI